MLTAYFFKCPYCWDTWYVYTRAGTSWRHMHSVGPWRLYDAHVRIVLSDKSYFVIYVKANAHLIKISTVQKKRDKQNLRIYYRGQGILHV